MTKPFMTLFILVTALAFGSVPLIFAGEDQDLMANEGENMEVLENQDEPSSEEDSYLIETTLETDEPSDTDRKYQKEEDIPSLESESETPKEN